MLIIAAIVPRFPLFLSSILRERSLCFSLLGAGGVLVGLHLAGLHLWRCAFLEATGLPCPGCGMTRAMGALCRGELGASLALHPFAPFVALVGVMLAVSVLAREPWRERWLARLEKLERRTGLPLLLLLSMMLWGLWRMSQVQAKPGLLERLRAL